MPTDAETPQTPVRDAGKTVSPSRPPLTPEAERALAEAAARRAASLAKPGAPREINGRGGLDPTRYGDWEINGLASDF